MARAARKKAPPPVAQWVAPSNPWAKYDYSPCHEKPPYAGPRFGEWVVARLCVIHEPSGYWISMTSQDSLPLVRHAVLTVECQPWSTPERITDLRNAIQHWLRQHNVRLTYVGERVGPWVITHHGVVYPSADYYVDVFQFETIEDAKTEVARAKKQPWATTENITDLRSAMQRWLLKNNVRLN